MLFDPKRNIRIGILMHGIFYGGATRSLFLLLKGLQKENFCFIIYTIGCHAESIKNELLKFAMDVKLVKIKTISVNQVYRQSFISYLINSNTSCQKFIDQIIEDKISILHINTTVFPHIPEMIKRKSDIKIIVHLREWLSVKTDGIIQRYMVKKISEFSDALIAISDNEAQLFKAHPNITILPNPFDFNNITKQNENFRKNYNINSEVMLVGMFSHFSPAKGHINFLRALKILVNRNSFNLKFKFIIVGFRDRRTWYKLLIKRLLFMKDYTNMVLRFIRKNRLQDHSILIPYTNDVFSILKAVDIVIRPADSADPWGRDIIEAMAFEKPIIATGSSGFFIKNKITGFLIPPKNPEILADSIEIMILDKSMREKMGSNAYNLVKEKCDLTNYASSLKDIYLSILT